MFQLSDEEIQAIQDKKKCYAHPRAASIEALKIVQKKRKWVCDDAIIEIAKILNISSEELEGIATFYSQIFRKPIGKNVILLCDSAVCFINGYTKIQKSIEDCLKISFGRTTSNKLFTFLPICCLGACDKGPVMLINEKLYTKIESFSIPIILQEYK